MSTPARHIVLPVLVCLELIFLIGFGLGFLGATAKIPYDPWQALNGAGFIAILLLIAFHWRAGTAIVDRQVARDFVEREMAVIIERLQKARQLPLRGSQRGQLATIVDMRLGEWGHDGVADRNQELVRQGVVIHPDDATFTGRLTDFSWSRAHTHEAMLFARALLCGEILGYLTALSCYVDDQIGHLSGQYLGECYRARYLERFPLGLPAEGLPGVPIPS